MADKAELQSEFDRLTELKKEKWEAIKDMILYRDTREWREIEDIDQQLWTIHDQLELEGE